ncbi:MAG: HAD family hydrolase, partial [Paramuribaculum sp.]|nr:HAD family hydrolase [Paramuribaculum sp.]
MNIRHLIFDFDGTLCDTAESIVTVMRLTVERLGLPVKSDAELRSVIGLRLDEVGNVLFQSKSGLGCEFASVYRQIYSELPVARLVRMVPYVRETLRALKEAGCDMVIATSRSRRSLLELMRNDGFGAFFNMVIDGDDGREGNPDPDASELS